VRHRRLMMSADVCSCLLILMTYYYELMFPTTSPGSSSCLLESLALPAGESLGG
jgi:hypothetical protein